MSRNQSTDAELTVLNGRVYRLGTYHPYRLDGEINPKVDKISKTMMDLKNSGSRGHSAAIEYFAKALRQGLEHVFKEDDVIHIVIAPSSEEGVISSALRSVVESCGRSNTHLVDGLKRTTGVESSHSGGIRSHSLHMSSISCDAAIPEDAIVIVLDDVYTTGSTMSACIELLNNSGAKIILGFALLKTDH